ncbi:MAG: hypothetical protein JST16_05780 [Bdellovibrionales bacterium]|nr:hypothetical protein [Bdellovibrionales bacterium]
MILRAWLLASLLATGAHATPAPCAPETARLLSVPTVDRSHFYRAKTNPVEQWLSWEQEVNLASKRQDTKPARLATVNVPLHDVDVQLLPGAPAWLKDKFVQGNHVVWPKHPYNQMDIVPHHQTPASGSMAAYFTSSRSMALVDQEHPEQLLSIKLPTNRPNRGKPQLKFQMKYDIGGTQVRTPYIHEREQKMQPAPHLKILLDVMTVADKKTGNGFIVRDLSGMDKDHYYMPAFSIPYDGRQIAGRNGAMFQDFWQKNYAEALGRAKAQLLLRHGLQMVTPNAQNILIEFDRNMSPTGTIVLRDLSDSAVVPVVARAIHSPAHFEQIMAVERRIEADLATRVDPNTQNSFWHMDEADHQSIPAPLLTLWQQAHDRAYIQELSQALGIQIETSKLPPAKMWEDITQILESPTSQKAIQRYQSQIQRL